jgi:hypothetical protein
VILHFLLTNVNLFDHEWQTYLQQNSRHGGKGLTFRTKTDLLPGDPGNVQAMNQAGDRLRK